jgi:hypothetical protein
MSKPDTLFGYPNLSKGGPNEPKQIYCIPVAVFERLAKENVLKRSSKPAPVCSSTQPTPAKRAPAKQVLRASTQRTKRPRVKT